MSTGVDKALSECLRAIREADAKAAMAEKRAEDLDVMLTAAQRANTQAPAANAQAGTAGAPVLAALLSAMADRLRDPHTRVNYTMTDDGAEHADIWSDWGCE